MARVIPSLRTCVTIQRPISLTCRAHPATTTLWEVMISSRARSRACSSASRAWVWAWVDYPSQIQISRKVPHQTFRSNPARITTTWVAVAVARMAIVIKIPQICYKRTKAAATASISRTLMQGCHRAHSTVSGTT